MPITGFFGDDERSHPTRGLKRLRHRARDRISLSPRFFGKYLATNSITNYHCRMDIKARFEEKVRLLDTGCWEWMGERTIKGYGRMTVGGRHKRAHRISYELYVGVIPQGLFVCHRCDRPWCVNPNHLYAGTNLTNVHDSMERGRRWFKNVLTAEKVRYIRESMEVARVLAERFGVSESAVYDAKNRRTWKHL